MILEYERRRQTIESAPLSTLYLGGGTPSLLDANELLRLMESFRATVGFSKDAEVTIEANPDDVTHETANAWREAGINRASLGIQSLNDDVLDWMHRTHSARQSVQALDALKSAGFESISVDFIFGLPKVARTNTIEELTRIASLGADHISAYGLTVESHTPLAKWAERKTVTLAEDSSYETEFLEIHDALESLGYEHYEVSNYSLPERRSIHNSAYWTGKSYMGLGPSAHSFDGAVRSWNVSPWAAYDRLMNDGMDPKEMDERLTEDQESLEKIYLGLRTSDGTSLKELESLHDSKRKLAEFAALGLIGLEEDRLILTPKGWLAMDTIIVSLTT